MHLLLLPGFATQHPLKHQKRSNSVILTHSKQWFALTRVFILFVGQKTQCPKIYSKLTQFEDNDSRKLL